MIFCGRASFGKTPGVSDVSGDFCECGFVGEQKQCVGSRNLRKTWLCNAWRRSNAKYFDCCVSDSESLHLGSVWTRLCGRWLSWTALYAESKFYSMDRLYDNDVPSRLQLAEYLSVKWLASRLPSQWLEFGGVFIRFVFVWRLLAHHDGWNARLDDGTAPNWLSKH